MPTTAGLQTMGWILKRQRIYMFELYLLVCPSRSEKGDTDQSWANATVGQTCVNDNTRYTAYQDNGSPYAFVVSRDK